MFAKTKFSWVIWKCELWGASFIKAEPHCFLSQRLVTNPAGESTIFEVNAILLEIFLHRGWIDLKVWTFGTLAFAAKTNKQLLEAVSECCLLFQGDNGWSLWKQQQCAEKNISANYFLIIIGAVANNGYQYLSDPFFPPGLLAFGPYFSPWLVAWWWGGK